MVMVMIGMTITAIFRVSYGWCLDGLFSDSPKTGANRWKCQCSCANAYHAYFKGDRYVSEVHMGRVLRILTILVNSFEV